MLVYFVRHGETTHNLARKKQHAHTQLTELGQKQAQVVAARLKSLPIEAVYTSHYDRAVSTAEAISQTLNLPQPTILENLHEFKSPAAVHDLHFDDPVLIEIETEIINHIEDQNWHYAEEENYYDFYQRAREILNDLSKLEHQTIAVVTHGGTLKALLYTLIMPEKWDSQTFHHLYKHTKNDNTALTIFEYTEEFGWKLISWNDHSHL